MSADFNICAVVQNGRLQFEAIPFVVSFFYHNPNFKGRLILMQPKPGPKWDENPTIRPDVEELLVRLGATILPFDNEIFGGSYANGNKIEGLKVLPDAPFVFFDTDTIFTGSIDQVPFDFSRPTASLKRENTWPTEHVYGPSGEQIWSSLYSKFGLDFDAAQNAQYPRGYWKRYPYYNAGWFYHQSPKEFGQRYGFYAQDIRDNPTPEIEAQQMFPWLDQIALPLVVHSFGGSKDALPKGYLDGDVSCHYRVLPLLYAREPDETIAFFEEMLAPNKIKKVLKQYRPFQKLLYQGKGHEVRALFNQRNLPRKEEGIRKKIKAAKLWMR